MQTVVRMGLDIAKNAFQVHGVTRKAKWLCASSSHVARSEDSSLTCLLLSWHRSLCWIALLGPRARGAWARCAVDGGAVRGGVPQERQE